mmetsp:Transcript_42431/g.123311  ORF Transcript_42431/g.123311 Transcript_42431/m.123311 type:complete len:365 (-) Transcript_42431:207-1301(-)
MNATNCFAEQCDLLTLGEKGALHGQAVDAESLGWLWRTMGATCCWAMSDVICDMIIRPVSAAAPADGSKDRSPSGHLSPQQNALVSGIVSLLTVAAASVFVGENISGEWSKQDFGAAFGGCTHFTAYLLTLCAFSSASSTVITPLMQLSAVWMLPFSTLAATLGLASFIRPVHLAAVVLICAGGFLPAADGCLSELASKRFWKQRAVRYVISSELLVCCYNLILHQATFGTQQSSDGGGNAGVIRFFLVSRTANGLACAALFMLVPKLRRHAVGLRHVRPRLLLAAIFGECLSMAGLCLVTFSYSSFYEPSVVNAAEGGLQQLFNLVFALTSHHVLGCGRAVEQVSVKCMSFALVVAGLTLSAA